MSEPQSIDERLVEAAKGGDVPTLAAILDEQPEKLHLRTPPYDWTLLHFAAASGHATAVDLLLQRGLDANIRETGDNTYAMHWAAAAGHLDVVRRLADAGGDVVGSGDDHALEVIGWASCWRNHHAAVVDFLVNRGARHHIFSAVAMNLADEVRRIVDADPSALGRRLTRNENHRTPLQHAIVNDRPEMVALLVDLGADPLAADGSGFPAAAYASAPGIDRSVMEKVREMASAEVVSAARGCRQPNISMLDLAAMLALGDFESAERLAREIPDRMTSLMGNGVLHLMAKRNDAGSVQWLLAHGADANARWSHWDAEVTPLHLAAAQGHPEIVRLLLEAGADPRVRDSKHDSDVFGWAEYFEQPAIVRLLEAHEKQTGH